MLFKKSIQKIIILNTYLPNENITGIDMDLLPSENPDSTLKKEVWKCEGESS